jgi:hypothetical protein
MRRKGIRRAVMAGGQWLGGKGVGGIDIFTLVKE